MALKSPKIGGDLALIVKKWSRRTAFCPALQRLRQTARQKQVAYQAIELLLT
jgi:hypothetical protein